MRINKLILAPLAAAIIGLSGCGGDSDNSDSNSATNRFISDGGYSSLEGNTISGRVVFARDLLPLGGIEIQLLRNGIVTATSTSSNDSGNPDALGVYAFESVSGGEYTIRAKSDAYAEYVSYEMSVYDYDETEDHVVVDEIVLGSKAKLQVLVTHDGVAIDGATVMAAPAGSTNYCAHYDVNSRLKTVRPVATSDAGGLAQFDDLNECAVYEFIVTPMDLDGDNKFDVAMDTQYNRYGYRSYETEIIPVLYAEPVLPIVMIDIESSTSGVIATNLTILGDVELVTMNAQNSSGSDLYEMSTFDGFRVIAKDGNIILTLNTPATIGTTIGLYYSDDFDSFDDDAAPRVLVDATASFDSTGLILTIDPVAELPENMILHLTGTLNFSYSTEYINYNYNYTNDELKQYVSLEDTGAILVMGTAAPELSIRNYEIDASTEGRLTLDSNSALFGTYRVLSTKKIEDAEPTMIEAGLIEMNDYYNDYVIYAVYTPILSEGEACVACASTPGVRFNRGLLTEDMRYSSYRTLGDFELAKGDEVTIEFNLKDIAGRPFMGERILVVQ